MELVPSPGPAKASVDGPGVVVACPSGVCLKYPGRAPDNETLPLPELMLGLSRLGRGLSAEAEAARVGASSRG